MSSKKSLAICLSILTFAPFSSQAMKENNIEMSEISDGDTSNLLDTELSSKDMKNLNDALPLIAPKDPKLSAEEAEEEEAKKLGVRNLACIICMDENPDDLLGLKCRHVFHQKCLADWTKMMQKKSWKCPVCQDILDPVRDALCQRSLEVKDFNTNQTEEENLLNILRLFYVEHSGWLSSLNNINVFCSTEDVDVGLLYAMVKNNRGEVTRIPCVMRDFPDFCVFRVGSYALRAQFDEFNNRAKSEVESWTWAQKDSFKQQFYTDFCLRFSFIRRLAWYTCKGCAKCTGLLCADLIGGYLLYNLVQHTFNSDLGVGEDDEYLDVPMEDKSQNQMTADNGQNNSDTK